MTCPACTARRFHTDKERADFHPLAGHGYTKEQGWTHPDAKAAHDRDVETARIKQAELDAQAKQKLKQPLNA